MAEIVYARVNSLLEDEFTLLGVDAARTPITGKVQGDFTILLSRGTTTGLSTAGVTITEIGSGKYDITIAAGSLTTTGVYTIRVSITVTGTAYIFEQVYAVTSDGTPSGTFGSSSFTATASNGRITNGTIALAGATVYVRDSLGNLYAATTSSATGVYTFYFTTNGTYYLISQLAGYAQGSGTLTVSGATVTLTPATDIAMTAISTGSGLTASELTSYARRMSFDKTGTKADTELLQSVNMAVDMVTKSKLWPKYVTRSQITLEAAYSTGTATTAVGLATITFSVAATVPTWAAGARILIAGQIYGIISRDSATQVTIEATWVDSQNVGALSYTIFQDTYALPDDLYRFGRLVPGQRWPYGGDPVSPEILIENQMIYPLAIRGPTMWAFIDQNIVVYPYPSLDLLCGYWYYRRPTPLVNPTDEADFDPAHIELLRRAIDYQVAVLYGSYTGGTPEQAMSRYLEAMGRGAPNDRTSATASSPLNSPGLIDVPVWLRRSL